MTASLTGYGRAEITDEYGRVSVELRSVNNRFLQIDIHLPYGFNWLDPRVRQYLSERLARGKVSVGVEIVDYHPSTEVVINTSLLHRLIDLRKQLEHEHETTLPLNFDGLLALPGVLRVDSRRLDANQLWERIEPVLCSAVEDFSSAREREGQQLQQDLQTRRRNLEAFVQQIEQRVPQFREDFLSRYTTRIRELSGQAGFDEMRLKTEIAVWSDRADVTEEITRLKSHLLELDRILTTNGPIGRRLDFLVQELHREATTFSNKIGDQDAQKVAIDMKCEIEKIREQAQNIE